MKVPRILVGILPLISCLCWAGPLPAQQGATQGERVERQAGAKEAAGDKNRFQLPTINGQTKANVHRYKMEKGNTYRITLKAEGFTPQVRIEDQFTRSLNPGSLPLTNFGPNNPGAPSPSNPGVAQTLFTATQTKEHQIRVDQVAGTDIGPGDLTYALTIEKASFQRLLDARDAELEVAENTKKLEQGKVYAITVTGNGFAPEMQILEGTRVITTGLHGRWFGFGPDAQFVANMTFAPAKTAEYRILVGVGPVSEKRRAPLTYTTEVVDLKLDLNVNDQLTKQDPIYPRRGGPHKVHTVKLEAGKNYQIDMMSRIFDTYLFLEDSTGKILMEDDDGGEGLNARIIFRPTKSDVYRIVATTFNRNGGGPGPGGPGPGGLGVVGAAGMGALGAYTLIVVQNPNAQPRFGVVPGIQSFGGPADFPKQP